MKCTKMFFLALLCSTLIAGTPLGSTAADKIPTAPSILGITSGTVPPVPPPPAPVTPPGNDGLLSGMTPGNYKIASGWSLLRAQDFEGTKPTGESWGSYNGTVTATRPHAGNKSIEGKFDHGMADVGWSLSSSVIGTFSEIYMSFYEYTESQALFNDEYALAEIGVVDVNQRIFIDWLWAEDSSGHMKINGDYAVLSFVNEQGPPDYTTYPIKRKVPVGTWVQWEIHFRPASADRISDGFIRVYKDGTLYTSSENKSFNYRMGKPGQPTYVSAGGYYNRLVWMNDYPTCTSCSTPGAGTDACTNEKNWFYLSFNSPICPPSTPIFSRFIDDVIVMKK